MSAIESTGHGDKNEKGQGQNRTRTMGREDLTESKLRVQNRDTTVDGNGGAQQTLAAGFDGCRGELEKRGKQIHASEQCGRLF